MNRGVSEVPLKRRHLREDPKEGGGNPNGFVAGNEREFQAEGTADANALPWKPQETLRRESKDGRGASEEERRGCGQKVLGGRITPCRSAE